MLRSHLPDKVLLRQKLLIWILCVSHGLVFVVSTPLWEGWDEAFHYSYVQHLAENRSLPIYGRSTISREITTSFEYAPLSYASNLAVGRYYPTFEDYWKLTASERLERDQRLRTIPGTEKTALPDVRYRLDNYEAHQPPLYYLVSGPIYFIFSLS